MKPYEQVLASLDGLNIKYELARHEKVKSIAECAVCEKLLGALMPRNIFLCTKNQSVFCLLVAHPESIFRTSSVSKQAGTSRLSFAPEEKISLLLNTYSGAVSPLGLMFDFEHKVRLLMDERLKDEEFLLFHPLDNTMSVKIQTNDLIKTVIPYFGHKTEWVCLESQEE